MRSGLVIQSQEDVLSYVKTLTEDEKRQIRISSVMALGAKAKQAGKSFALFLKVQQYLLSIKGKDTGTSVDLEFATTTDKKEVVMTNVVTKETYTNGLKCNKKGHLDGGSVVDFMMGLMPSFVDKGSKGASLYQPSSGCPKDFKIKAGELGCLMEVFEDPTEKTYKNVQLDLADQTGYHQVLVDSAPSVVTVEAAKTDNGVPVIYTHTVSNIDTTCEKEDLALLKNVVKITHPKGGIRRFCEERAAYGVPLTVGQMKVIAAINDHNIPKEVNDLHLYTKDHVYAIAYRNKYPDLTISVLGSLDAVVDKGKFSIKTENSMIKTKTDKTMRISFDMITVPFTEIGDAIPNGAKVDEKEKKRDSKYTYYSRYMSVYSMGEDEKCCISFYTAKGYGVRTNTRKCEYDRHEMLNKFINMKLHVYLYLYIWIPLINFYPIGALHGKYQSKMTNDDEMMFSRAFRKGAVNDFLKGLVLPDSSSVKQNVVVVEKKVEKPVAQSGNRLMFDSLLKATEEEDSSDEELENKKKK